MTVYDIIEKWLKDNNLFGLCCKDCDCDIDSLAPNDCFKPECEPGIEIIIGKNGEKAIIPYDLSSLAVLNLNQLRAGCGLEKVLKEEED
jgi:hypothetical protein